MATDPRRDLVEEVVAVGERTVVLVHPRDSAELLDEEAFEREEFLPYWAELWPSAVVLARRVAARDLAGVRVLELGCGLGLPSITAALGGARVLASDWSPDAVAFAAENAARNGVTLETAVCSWAEPGPLLAGAPWDLVLAADVLYERRNVAQLLALLPRLVDGDGEVWIADPGRRPSEPFLAGAADRWRREDATDPDLERVTLHRLRKLG